ncbi:hypothetical protein TSOC_005693 [Tetrabaena socialis]|uniref:Major facilitator superfamily (MFS) profile domain-containing protein n=1 Tax=Tetrabaena socialis TaxID=47790 RepID=A0A2J8A5K7_9CHLO|nr:hypothetical protein TSOC_005693 [Tetrabaena socialis]|eukprot:PNH07804.1 hypothetical protein TSOC_005693 [Tetrabaena socialis]
MAEASTTGSAAERTPLLAASAGGVESAAPGGARGATASLLDPIAAAAQLPGQQQPSGDRRPQASAAPAQQISYRARAAACDPTAFGSPIAAVNPVAAAGGSWNAPGSPFTVFGSPTTAPGGDTIVPPAASSAPKRRHKGAATTAALASAPSSGAGAPRQYVPRLQGGPEGASQGGGSHGGGGEAGASHRSRAYTAFLAMRQRTVFLVNLVSIMERMDEQIVPALSRPLGCAFHATPHQLGLITSARAVVQALASPLGGLAGHYFDRVTVLFVGCCIWGFFCAAFSCATTVNQGIAAWAFNGVGLALIIPNSQSLIADYYTATQRGEAFGMLMLTGAMGGMLGAMFATNLGSMSPLGMDGWRVAFATVGAASIAIGAFTLLLAMDPTRTNTLPDCTHRRRRAATATAGGRGARRQPRTRSDSGPAATADATAAAAAPPLPHRRSIGGNAHLAAQDVPYDPHHRGGAGASVPLPPDGSDSELEPLAPEPRAAAGGPSPRPSRTGAAAPAALRGPPPASPAPLPSPRRPLLPRQEQGGGSSRSSAELGGASTPVAAAAIGLGVGGEVQGVYDSGGEDAWERQGGGSGRRRSGLAGGSGSDGGGAGMRVTACTVESGGYESAAEAVLGHSLGGRGGDARALTWRRLYDMLTTPTFLIIIAQARALGDAMLLFMAVPWTLCALFYTGLHWFYPHDKARALRPQVAVLSSGGGSGYSSGDGGYGGASNTTPYKPARGGEEVGRDGASKV